VVVLALLGGACRPAAHDGPSLDASVDGDVGDGGPSPDSAMSSDPLVTTAQGPVRGRWVGASQLFQGIPYAAPPVGALRWRPPTAPAPWSSPRDALAFGPVCPQLDAQTQAAIGDEDCLTLNVWAPAKAASALPVMVFIHGGGHFQGSAAEQHGGVYTYDGQYASEHGGVVVVTLNYRLGALGYLAHAQLAAEQTTGTTGNYGVLDQNAALAWVQANIAAFGGDPTRVMLFGESAGAFDTCIHLVSPTSKGLFARALMESGQCTADTLPTAEATAAHVLSAVGCDTASDPIACLRALPAADLIQKAPGSLGSTQGFRYQSTIDGYVLADAPMTLLASGAGQPVPFVLGSNADEGAFFLATQSFPDAASYHAYVYAAVGVTVGDQVIAHYPALAFPTPKAAAIAVYTDSVFTCPARRIARAALQAGAPPVRRYFFTHKMEEGPLVSLGAFHGQELTFVFHNPTTTLSSGELGLADAMVGYWTRFAAGGDPNGGGAPSWPAYAAATDDYLKLDDAVMAGQGVRSALCDFWDTVQ
jgi:para-nitrobenzyl esterase